MTLTLDTIVHVLMGWLIGGVALAIVTWRLTRNVAAKPRIVIRSLALSVAFGFTGMGTDGAAIPLPLLLLMSTGSSDMPELLFTFFVIWLVVAAIYLGVHARMRGRVEEER